jgi:hypothetical protein
MALPSNIRTGWKGLSGSNALAYLVSPCLRKKMFSLKHRHLGPMLYNFLLVIREYLYKARVFVTGKHLQPCLMFAGKARRIPKSGAPERCFTRVGSGLFHKH